MDPNRIKQPPPAWRGFSFALADLAGALLVYTASSAARPGADLGIKSAPQDPRKTRGPRKTALKCVLRRFPARAYKHTTPPQKTRHRPRKSRFTLLIAIYPPGRQKRARSAAHGEEAPRSTDRHPPRLTPSAFFATSPATLAQLLPPVPASRSLIVVIVVDVFHSRLP